MVYKEIVLDLMDYRSKLAAARAKGRAEAKKQKAKALLAEGCSIDVVVIAAEMTKEELLKLLELE